jgi:hypothetical protein
VDQENVNATLTIAVSAARVFAVLTDPTAHSAIDGTGWVQEAADRAPLTEVGQIFRMDMYHPNHPDGNYQMANKVQVLDPPRAISPTRCTTWPSLPHRRPGPGRPAARDLADGRRGPLERRCPYQGKAWSNMHRPCYMPDRHGRDQPASLPG